MSRTYWSMENAKQLEGCLLYNPDKKEGLRLFIIVLSVDLERETCAYIGDDMNYSHASEIASLRGMIDIANDWEVHK